MHCRLTRRNVFRLALGLLAGTTLRADNQIQWSSFSLPSAATGGSVLYATATVTNLGDDTWGGAHNLVMKNSSGTPVAMVSLDGVEPWQTVSVTISYGLPDVTATYTFHFQALEHEVEYFGPTYSGTVSVTQRPPYIGMQLSATTFDRLDPALISTADTWVTATSAYRLRAKVIDGTAWGWHAANWWNRNTYPLDNPPPVGNYATCSLYWVRYTTLYGEVLQVGPERLLPISVTGSVTLSSNWFHVGSPPTISTNENMAGSTYRLFATFQNSGGTTWETSTGYNNNGATLANLPPAGTYQVSLYWRKYDAAMAVTAASPVRTATVQVTAGPVLVLNAGGFISGDTTYDEEYGTWDTSYDEVTHAVQVPVAGMLRVRAIGADGGDMFLNLYSPDGQPLQSGIPEVAAAATPGAYTVFVTADRFVGYTVVGEVFPFATLPAITSAAAAGGTVGSAFSAYTATATGSSPVTFSAPAPGVANGLPPGLALAPATGAITGTPTAAGTYQVWLTANNGAGSVGKWVTFTIGLRAPVAFAAKELDTTGFLATWSPVPGATQYRFDLATDAGFNQRMLRDVAVAYTVAGQTASGLSYWIKNASTTPIQQGTTYYYRVRAFDGSTLSATSNPVAVTIPLYPTAASSTAEPLLLDIPQWHKQGNDWIRIPDGVPDSITPLGLAGGSSIWIVDLPPEVVTIGFSGDVNSWFGLHPTYTDLDGNNLPDGTIYAPAVIWESDLSFTQYLDQKFVVGIEFPAKPGRSYEIYSSPAAIVDPGNLSLWGGPYVFDTDGPQTIIAGDMLARDFRGRAFYLVEHVFAPAGVQITLPVIGDITLRKGIGGASGAITVLGDVTLEASTTAVKISKASGGATTVANGTVTGSLDLGDGHVVTANAGGITLTTATGAVIGATTGGITMTLPGGISATVSPNGAVALSVPMGAAAALKNAVDQMGRLLGLGASNGPAPVAQVVVPGGAPSETGWSTANQILLGDRPAGDYDVWVKEDRATEVVAVTIRMRVQAPNGSLSGPPRMWVNDDNDAGDFGSADTPADSARNCDDAVVNGVRDLVDFFPVAMNLRDCLAACPPGPDVRYLLKQSDGAVNFAYTNLTATNASNIHRDVFASGFGDDFSQAASSAQVHRVTAAGTELSVAFLQRVANGTGNVILLEGCAPSSSPLVLSVERADGRVMTSYQFSLRISRVESMFRHVDLSTVNREYGGLPIAPSPAAMPARTGDPGAAYPDSATNGKYFVFVHGYNVDGQQARGWQCEVFKRLYQLGSRARFVGVTWHGATGLDYHKAVFHSFQTGSLLGTYLNQAGVTGDVTVAAHSLGNMLVSHAIATGGFTPTRYYMINGAVPLEAYDYDGGSVTAEQRLAMTESKWTTHLPDIFAANWHRLFAATPSDQRNELTWKNRFRDVLNIAYNFYTPGEDVVSAPVSNNPSVLRYVWEQGFASVRGMWALQEMIKGANIGESLGAVTAYRVQGGWGLSVVYPPDLRVSPDPRREPYFGYFAEMDLFHADPAVASAKAAQKFVQYDLLATGIPALSFATALMPLTPSEILPNRNFNMQLSGRTPGLWPTEGHAGADAGQWLHGDVRDVALPCVYRMYEEMINLGALR